MISTGYSNDRTNLEIDRGWIRNALIGCLLNNCYPLGVEGGGRKWMTKDESDIAAQEAKAATNLYRSERKRLRAVE